MNSTLESEKIYHLNELLEKAREENAQKDHRIAQIEEENAHRIAQIEKENAQQDHRIAQVEEELKKLKTQADEQSYEKLYPFSTSPSSTKTKDVKKHQSTDKYYFSSHYLFIEAFLCYFYRKILLPDITNATKKFMLIFNECMHSEIKVSNGYLSQKTIDKPGKSAILATSLPRIEETSNYTFIYIHQAHLLVNDMKKKTGKVDISLYAQSNHDVNVMLPLVAWEMSLNDDFKLKRNQLFNTATSMMIYQMKGSKYPLLGIIFNQHKFEIHIYFASKGKVVDFILEKNQETNTSNWQGLFNVIEKWSRSIERFLMNDACKFYAIANSRVCRNENLQYVYKTYDYRYLKSSYVNNRNTRRRSPQFYGILTPSIHYLIDQPNLKIIYYKCIEGDHIAKQSKEFINILNQLQHLHSKNIVHGDIRLRNIIFNHEDVTKSSLIDFDYSGRVGEDRYPSTLCEVPDGIRTTKMMNGDFMDFKCDNICMSHCMGFFRVENMKYKDIWNDCLEFTKTGELLKVIEILEQSDAIKLRYEEKSLKFQEYEGTGSPENVRNESNVLNSQQQPKTKSKKDQDNDKEKIK